MTAEQQDNYEIIQREMTMAGARLIAISKTHPVEKIQAYYDLGHRDFGENRVAEFLEKQAVLPADINWHFIGHLQRNKVKELVGKIGLIHSVDSPRLLREINKQAVKADTQVEVLLQFHIAAEESKYGLTAKVAKEMLRDPELKLPGVRIKGVMGMATYTDIDEQIADEFQQLKDIFDELKSEFFADDPHFREISMGMSGDYPIALEKGSTMVRVGSLLFGNRNYG
ncbi:YggS family pyridoxal phosphate-dependent enzyme [Lewinellaceae bacterium SD302]|nr:YggS family pyridoxal phosphate-dependent enzyme [Lewinellaceae bacterium SD302]